MSMPRLSTLALAIRLLAIPEFAQDRQTAGELYFMAATGNKSAFLKLTTLASSGDPLAQYYLGRMYNSGEGVPKDMPQALRWYRRAAERGNPLAQSALA